MKFIDTHAHLYASEFDSDRSQIIERALKQGVEIMLLPNIDKESVEPMHQLCDEFPSHFFPMMGLHPSSAKDDYAEILKEFKNHFSKRKYIAVGEIGIDLYWDKSYFEQQKTAFKEQLIWAKEFDLPVVIHSREAHTEIIECIDELNINGLRGVFHCFSGTLNQAHEIIDRGFLLGIGGVLTFKNSTLAEVISNIDLKHLLLETDAPYLSPVPHRGKRNESAYIPLIAQRLAEAKGLDIEYLSAQLLENTKELFRIK